MTPVPEPNATALDWMKKALAAPLLLAKLGSRPADPPPKTAAEREALAFMKAAQRNPVPLVKLYNGTRGTDPPPEDSEALRLMKIALGIALASSTALAKRAPAAGNGEWTEVSEDGRVKRSYDSRGNLKKIRLLEGGEIPVHGMSAHTLSPSL